MSILLRLITILLISSLCHAQAWENRNYYDHIGAFIDGYAYVVVNGKYGFINDKGEEVVPCVYDEFQGYDLSPDFFCGLAGVRQGDKWGFVDTTGRVVVPLIYEYVGRFINNVGYVKLEGKWGLINTRGEFLTEIKYFNLWYPNAASKYRLAYNGSSGYLDESGKEVIPFEYEDGRSFSEGLAAVKRNNKWGFIDEHNNVVIPFEFDNAYVPPGRSDDSYNFFNGLAKVQKGINCGMIDKQGAVKVPFEYSNIYNTGKSDIIAVQLPYPSGAWGFVDTSGRQLAPAEFEFSYYQFAANGAVPLMKQLDPDPAKRVNKYALFNASFQPVTDFKFDAIFWIDDSLGIAIQDNRKGIINSEGKMIIPCIFDQLIAAEKNMLQASLNGKSGYLSKNGDTIIPFAIGEASYISIFWDSIASTTRGHQQQVIDIKGNCLFNCDSAKQIIAVDFQNGRKSVRGTMEHFYKQGKWKFYYENGQPKHIECYKNGKEHGTFKYYQNPDGKLTSATTYEYGEKKKEVFHALNGTITVHRYKNDKRHGKQVTRTDSTKDISINYEGRLVSSKHFEQGKLTLERIYDDYKNYYEIRHERGKFYSSGRYSNFQMTGPWTVICYDCNDTCGKTISRGTYINGMKHNDWVVECKRKRRPPPPNHETVKTYHSQNVVNTEHRTQNGYIVGPYKEYFQNGKVQTEGTYTLGFIYYGDSLTTVVPLDDDYVPEANEHVGSFMTGTWKFYYENGNLASEGDYRMQNYLKDSIPDTIVDSSGKWTLYTQSIDDVKTGEWKYYAENGKHTEKGSWIPGIYKQVFNTESSTYVTPREFKDGTWTYYNEAGEEIKQEVYQQGILVETKNLR